MRALHDMDVLHFLSYFSRLLYNLRIIHFSSGMYFHVIVVVPKGLWFFMQLIIPY